MVDKTKSAYVLYMNGPLDKKATLSKLRLTYKSILNQTEKMVSTNMVNTNSEYMRCFAEVGEKLDILEKQEESPDLITAWKKPSTTTTEPEKALETDYDAFVKDIPVASSGWDPFPVSGSLPVGAFVKDIPVASSEELDPVTKVAQWQQNKAPIQQGIISLQNFCL